MFDIFDGLASSSCAFVLFFMLISSYYPNSICTVTALWHITLCFVIVVMVIDDDDSNIKLSMTNHILRLSLNIWCHRTPLPNHV